MKAQFSAASGERAVLSESHTMSVSTENDDVVIEDAPNATEEGLLEVVGLEAPRHHSDRVAEADKDTQTKEDSTKYR